MTAWGRREKTFEQALKDQGYATIIAIGFKEDGDDYRVKIATRPELKSLSPETWEELLLTITGGLAKLYNTPLDDLEIQ